MAFKVINQEDVMDCGAACLAMVCKHFGKSISLSEVRKRAQVSKQGTSILGISEAAESFGFHTLAAQLPYEKLSEVSLPCILHWSQTHFVVLTGIQKKNLFNKKEEFRIADPAVAGLITIDKELFRHNWISNNVEGQGTGVALLLEPTQAFFDHDGEDDSFSSKELEAGAIFNYVLRYRDILVQLAISIIIAAFFQLLLPFLTQSIVDTGIQTDNLHFVYIVLLAQVVLFCGKLTVDFIRSWLLLHISTRINVSILTDFLIKLMKLPVNYFDSKQTGDILQRMADHGRIENFLTGSSLNAVFSLVSLVIFSWILAFYNTVIFFVFLLSGFLYIAWTIFFLKKRRRLDYNRFSISSREQGARIQIIQGMQEIKLQNCGKHVRWNWERIQAKLFNLNVKSLSLDQWQQSGALFINEGKNILTTFFCAKAVIEGQMTLGTMLAVQYIIGQLNAPIEQMTGFIQSWQNARISIERLNEIHHIEDEEPPNRNYLNEIPTTLAKPILDGKDLSVEKQEAILTNGLPESSTCSSHDIFPSIIFNKVTFAYQGAGNDPVLESISLTIPTGKTTAIVGVSGSGKTTLLKLLLRFYEPRLGEIYLGQTPLNIISHRVWRQHCGVVMQDSYIFSDTIARNIAVGEVKIDMDRLMYAAKVANIQDLIERFPLGFNTKIGQEGNGISMGQRQRILIARAVYKDPDYIFLDEATNSLDAHNESKIIKNLEQFLRGKTVVVVAHRLSTVKHAEQIILLDKGKIAERGTHRELANLKGKYYELVKNQLDLGD